MPLQIQTDESLTSYVQRNLYLSWHLDVPQTFHKLATRHVLKNTEVKRLAEAMGWLGCYGFNRLIHGHSMMASSHVFKGYWDLSYSGNQYVSRGERFSVWGASFCPECVREDLKVYGFSYWRRYAAPHVSVCFKHNAVLHHLCPFCEKPFDGVGHQLDVMWRMCSGRHLAEAPLVPNDDPKAFRRGRIYHQLCTSTHHISDVHAVATARRKAAELSRVLKGETAAKIERLYDDLGILRNELAAASNSGRAPITSNINSRICEAVVSVYEHSDDFVEDLASMVQGGATVESLWCTHLVDGDPAMFIEDECEQAASRLGPDHTLREDETTPFPAEKATGLRELQPG
ncbi:TniQ family protein [Pseudomonas putida]